MRNSESMETSCWLVVVLVFFLVGRDGFVAAAGYALPGVKTGLSATPCMFRLHRWSYDCLIRLRSKHWDIRSSDLDVVA